MDSHKRHALVQRGDDVYNPIKLTNTEERRQYLDVPLQRLPIAITSDSALGSLLSKPNGLGLLLVNEDLSGGQIGSHENL